MTVAELIARLSTFPQDAVVVLSRDAEGNGYSPIDGAEVGLYFPENTWSGEFYTTRDEIGNGADDEDEDDDGDDEDTDEEQDGLVGVALWPVN